MGGIGKTTLMKKIYNGFAKIQCFNIVIWVTVPRVRELIIIQQKIGEELQLKFQENEGIQERSAGLYNRLRKVRYMLILDDVWEPFSLEKAGIPLPDKKNRCKIAITTWSMEVSNQMRADKEIQVSTLTSMEAWDLFCSRTGDVVYKQEIQTIAEKVVEECRGLPLAIAVLGGAMHGKDREELWKNALRALRRGVAPADIAGMNQNVFCPLKLSYDYLEDSKIQLCFLYCCLFPNDWEINIYELVNYWISEAGLIDNVDTLEEAVNKGLAIVEKLKDSCLLEILRDDNYSFVKMHDLLRDMAIWITSSPSSSTQASPKFFVNCDSNVPPEAKDWESFERISIMSRNVMHLKSPNCPNLVFLRIRDDCNFPPFSLSQIHLSDGFFLHMPQLRILNLSFTTIRLLPPSLSLLVNLRALILTFCWELVGMPPLGELKELQILDVSRTGIKELPEGISKLVKLKQLDLSYTKALDKIPCNFISQLTSLQHLRLFGSEDVHVSVSNWREIAKLKLLEHLAIDVPDLHSFIEDDIFLIRSLSNCKRFCVLLGRAKEVDDKQGILEDMRGENELEIFGFNDLSGWVMVIEELMRIHLGCLTLARCSNLESVSRIIGHSQTLKMLVMDDCGGVKCIIDWREVVDSTALDYLERLSLSELPDLRSIFYGAPSLPLTHFQRLQKVNILLCPKLECIFSSSMGSHLHQLEDLDIRHCEEVAEVVQGEILPNDALQRLRRVCLFDLPKLTSFCMQLSRLKSLEEIEVSYCPMLRKLPPLSSDIQRVKGNIRGPREWWERMEWEDDHSKHIYWTIYKEEKENGDASSQNQSPREPGGLQIHHPDGDGATENLNDEGIVQDFGSPAAAERDVPVEDAIGNSVRVADEGTWVVTETDAGVVEADTLDISYKAEVDDESKVSVEADTIDVDNNLSDGESSEEQPEPIDVDAEEPAAVVDALVRRVVEEEAGGGNIEYQPVTSDYTWSNHAESLASLCTSPSDETGIDNGENIAGPVAVPDVKAKFVKPFQHLASNFSVREQRPLSGMEKRTLARLLAYFRESFAISMAEVEAPDDLNVLLGLCSDLLTSGDRIGVEMMGLPKVMQLLMQLRSSWHALKMAALSSHPEALLRNKREQMEQMQGQIDSLRASRVRAEQRLCDLLAERMELKSEQEADMAIKQAVEGRMAKRGTRLEKLGTDYQDAVEECATDMVSRENRLLLVKADLKRQEDAAARVSDSILASLKEIHDALSMLRQVCLEGFNGPTS